MKPFLALLALAVFESPPAVDGATAAPVAAPPRAIDKIVVLGASLSQGFNLEQDLGAPATLADVLEAAILPEHERALSRSSLLFFLQPAEIAKQQVEQALKEEPTLVVALDFLFWFAYGEAEEGTDRMARFESGLALLERFDAPLLVGDVPDMRRALSGKPQMLQEQQIPPPEALAAVNARLAAWAEERPQVVVASLVRFAGLVEGGEAFRVRRSTFLASELPELLQPDQLHTTAHGTIGVALVALDELVRKRPEIPARWFEWDRRAIHRKLYRSKEAERQQKFEAARLKWVRDHPPPPPPAPAPQDEEAKRKRERDGEDG